jgi:hypothetical protein
VLVGAARRWRSHTCYEQLSPDPTPPAGFGFFHEQVTFPIQAGAQSPPITATAAGGRADDTRPTTVGDAFIGWTTFDRAGESFHGVSVVFFGHLPGLDPGKRPRDAGPTLLAGEIEPFRSLCD